MNEETFWKLIEEAKAKTQPELSNQPQLLRKNLEALPPEDIAEFGRIFQTLHSQAYRWDLWAAGYIIEGGCSDDGFRDFRAGLIGLGRGAYYDAIRDPGTLIRQPTRGVDFSQEELLYAADEAYSAVAGRPMPEHHVHDPDEPLGEPWDEASLAEKYPELAKKFGFAG
jgi:hypothetical protein